MSLFDKYLSYLGLLLQDSAGVNLCQSRYVLLCLSIFFARLDWLLIVILRAQQLISTWRAGLQHASIVPWQISTPMCDSWSWYRPSSCRWCPFLGKEFHGDTHWPSGRGVAWNAAQDVFARRHPTMQRWGYSGGSTLWMWLTMMERFGHFYIPKQQTSRLISNSNKTWWHFALSHESTFIVWPGSHRNPVVWNTTDGNHDEMPCLGSGPDPVKLADLGNVAWLQNGGRWT